MKKEEKKEEEKIVIFTSFYESEAGSLYEEIYNPDTKNTSFISWDQPPKKEGKLKTFQHVDIGKKRITPLFNKALEEKAVLLPEIATDYGDLQKFVKKDIRGHIHKYSDVSRDFEVISSWYVLLTWVYDRCNTLPYLRVLGDSGTGKSRYLDVVGRLCYKPMIVSGAINPAPIYRMIRTWGGTMILDEADFRMSDEKNEVIKILNCGFERGRPVLRCKQNNADNIQILPSFSPKVFATRKRFIDTALESRCLTEIMKETQRDDIPILLPRRFYKEELELRNKLLMYRLKNRNKINPDTALELDLGEIESRLKQAMLPFAVLFSNLDGVMNDFKTFLGKYNRDLIEERSQSYDGMIVNAIHDLIPVTNVTLDTNVTPDPTISAGDISDYIYTVHNLEKKPTPQGIGKHLKILGLDTELKRVEGEPKRVIVWDQPKLNRLFKRYVVTNETSVTNVTGEGDP